MTRTIILTFFSFIVSGTVLAQDQLKDCSKNPFRLSKPEPWQRDSTQSRTFIRNCHASTVHLVLYNDSTFQYKVDRCGTGGYAEGKWRINSRKRIELFDSRKSDRKLISIHKDDYSLTYMIENVDNETFRTKGTNLVRVVK